MNGLQFFSSIGLRWFLAMALVTCFAVAMIYALSNDDGVGSDGVETESEMIDYRDLYDHEGVGKNMELSIDVPIDGSIDIEVPVAPSMFPVYEYQPLDLEDMDSIESFVATHNLSIVNHRPIIIGYPYSILYQMPPVRFQNETENIVVYAHRNINVRFDITDLPSRSTRINKSQAFEIAENFLRDHYGIPDDIYKILPGSSKDTYHFRYIQKVDGYPVFNSGARNQILITIDKTKAAVLRYSHHWPSLSKVGEIPEEDIGDLDALLNGFVYEHNKQLESDSRARILSVDYYYSATIGYGPSDNAHGSPWYIYLPYLKISWDTGTTFISPLSTVGT